MELGVPIVTGGMDASWLDGGSRTVYKKWPIVYNEIKAPMLRQRLYALSPNGRVKQMKLE